MRAAVYEGLRTVTVKDVPDAKIERLGDILVKITTTNICGSDLHKYEGRTSFETGRTLDHENLGQVVEVGTAVSKVKVGWVVLPFNIACGFCKQCEQGLTNCRSHMNKQVTSKQQDSTNTGETDAKERTDGTTGPAAPDVRGAFRDGGWSAGTSGCRGPRVCSWPSSPAPQARPARSWQ